MAYQISATPAKQVVGSNTTPDKAASDSANAFMSNWESQNPTGYGSVRDFEMGNPQGFADYQNRRSQAYSQWQNQYYGGSKQAAVAPNSQGGVTNPAGSSNMGIIAGAQQPVARAPVQTMAQPNTASAGGIINRNIGGMVDAQGNITGVSQYNAAQVGDPRRWDVTSEQTMQGQLQGLMAKDNPLLQMARSRALEQMNERGLSNSSLAVGASEAAAYDTMLPIAQNDSNVYASSAKDYADTSNQFSLQNVAFQNDALKNNADAANQAGRTNSTNLTSRLNAATALEGTKYNADKDFAGRVYTSDRALEGTKYSSDSSLKGTMYSSDNSLKGTMYASDNSLKGTMYSSDRSLEGTKYASDNSLKGTMYSADTQRELGYLDANTRTNIAQMQNATQLAVTDLSKRWESLISSNSAAADLMRNQTVQIAAIDRDPNLSSDGKRNAIERQLDLTENGMNLLGQVANNPSLAAYYNTYGFN